MRPFKRVYRWDPTRAAWIDVRILATEDRLAGRLPGYGPSVDPLVKGRWYRSFTAKPIWVDSRSQLKALCQQYHCVEAG